MGGVPPLSPAMTWPTKDGAPLTFLACLDLQSLSTALPLAWLPTSGRLLFFYDIDKQPWGFDPKDRGGWAVMFAADDANPPERSSTPRSLPRHDVSLHSINTYPSWERAEITALSLNDAESDRLSDLSASVYGDAPCHQVGGFPNVIQNDDMEHECELVSHGIYCGDASHSNEPEVERLRDGAGDWRLLLQVDSDDDLDVMWGDAGVVYFWIREQDARAGRFENAWVVLQCF